MADPNDHIGKHHSPAPHQFVLTIELGNEAMQDSEDIAHALEVVAGRIRFEARTDFNSIIIRDRNGNNVGSALVVIP